MQILLNGEPHETEAQTIADLLREQAAPGRGIAVALNGAVVRRAEHATHPLKPGDSIEIIRAVQGG